MKKPHSLVGKLTLLISISLIIIWLITIFTTTYIALNQNQQRVIDNLSRISALKAGLSNQRFSGAERDARELEYHHRLYQSVPGDELLKAQNEDRYFPVNPHICMPDDHQARELSFIQAYGSVCQAYYLDSFILDRRYGIFLQPPLTYSLGYFSHRQDALWQLPLHATHDNIFWGEPQYIPDSGWSVSVAVSSSDTDKVLVGLAVRLDDLLSWDHPGSENTINLWLDNQNHILPFSALPQKQVTSLKPLLLNTHLRDGWQHIPGYLVLRQKLSGPGWQQLVLYPTNETLQRALHIVLGQLPFALAALLLLAGILCWLLHRYLARPLWDFVDIIKKTGPDSLASPLPENRHRELSSISHAYNLLLDALRTQYDTLEKTVTERTHELVIARQQAEQASKRKSRHLTTISHELRTPLNGVLGALELLQMTPVSEKQVQLTDTARQCTLSLLGIINNLLDFSRIEAGQLSLHVETTPLLPLLDQAMHTIQGPGQRKGLTLRTIVGHNVPLHIEVDGTRLRQILVNLLGNALKFTDKGGICLSVKRCEKSLIFAVSDSGQGITASEQREIFEPFFQCHGHQQGTGLGLTISTNLAEMMGGRLELCSSAGLGTCISLLLPLETTYEPECLSGDIAAPLSLHNQLRAWGLNCQEAEQENIFCAEDLNFLPGKLRETVIHALSGKSGNEPHTLPVQPWRLRILLVDDSDINREIVSMMLASLGQDVTLAASGQQALILGRKTRFDLVLMDIRMPDMDGMVCTQQWRQDAAGQDPDCMIMALSANTAPEEISRCKQAGMQHYLTKPVSLNQLANSIATAVEYQLGRDISLQEQDSLHQEAILPLDDAAIRQKVQHSLHQLLSELEQNLYCLKTTSSLLHTLKGCLGQAGLKHQICYVIDLENRIQHGLLLTEDDIAELRHALDSTLAGSSPS